MMLLPTLIISIMQKQQTLSMPRGPSIKRMLRCATTFWQQLTNVCKHCCIRNNLHEKETVNDASECTSPRLQGNEWALRIEHDDCHKWYMAHHALVNQGFLGLLYKSIQILTWTKSRFWSALITCGPQQWSTCYKAGIIVVQYKVLTHAAIGLPIAFFQSWHNRHDLEPIGSRTVLEQWHEIEWVDRQNYN